MASPKASVAENAANEEADVATIQRLLNRVPPASGRPSPLLAVGGICAAKTLKAIRAHLRLLPMRQIDPANIISLSLPRCEDPKAPGVKR